MTITKGLYSSIKTMPITVWHEILETNNLNLLYKPINSESRPITLFSYLSGKYWWITSRLGKHFRKLFRIKTKSIDLFDVWLDVQQEFFDEFGVDIEFQLRMKKMKKYIVLMAEYIVTEDRKLLNKIQELELDMQNWGEEQSIRFYDLVSKLERVRKVPLVIETMTVIRWYHIMKDTVDMQEQTPQK